MAGAIGTWPRGRVSRNRRWVSGERGSWSCGWTGWAMIRGRVGPGREEKSKVKALARPRPGSPMRPGMRERRTHDSVRHGTTSLFAAFNPADGTVISSLHRRHRTVEFKKFLAKIDAEVPAHLD